MLLSLKMASAKILLLLVSSQLLQVQGTFKKSPEEFQDHRRPNDFFLGIHSRQHRLSSAVADSYLALSTLIQEFPPTLLPSPHTGNLTLPPFQSSVTGSLCQHIHPNRYSDRPTDALPRGSTRRQLQLTVALPPTAIPSVPETNTTNATFIVLAPNRTRRPNPMKDFKYYDGGWDFFSADYWASLAWTTVYGAGLGFVWLLFGVGIVVWVLMTCICCRHNWAALRDKKPKYKRSALTLPLVFMLFGVALELVGFGLMVSGAVKFTDTAHSLTNFTVAEVQRVSNVVMNVTPILRQLADTKSVLNYSVNPELRTKLLEIADKVDNIAMTAQEKSAQAGTSVNHVLDVLQTILFCVGIITVGFVLIGLIFTCCRLVVLSNIITVIVWFLSFVTWVLVTVFLFVWLFGGDTTVSLGEISVRPTDLSKFNVIVPCMDPPELDVLAAFARFIGYQTITIVNATITQEAPFIFQLMQAPAGLCNPFGPAPNYTYTAATCRGACDPAEPSCNGSTITLGNLAKKFAGLKCNSTNTTQCIVVNTVTSAVEEVAQGAEAIADTIAALLPLLEKILRCAYISSLAAVLQSHIGEMEYDTFLLWMGFMFVSIGAIFFGACAPIYVYRAVRCFKRGGGSGSETEPMKGASSLENYGHSSSSPYNNNPGDYATAQPTYENGASWAARPAPNY